MAQINADSTIKLTLPKFIAVVLFIVTTTFGATVAYSKLTETTKEFDQTKQEVAEMKVAITKISTLLELMQQEQAHIKTDVNVTKESLNTLRNESIVTNTYISEELRKKHR